MNSTKQRVTHLVGPNSGFKCNIIGPHDVDDCLGKTIKAPPKIDMMPLKSFLFLQICWRGETPYGTPPGFRRVDVLPTNSFPLGRKGHTLLQSWDQMAEKNTYGMLLLDADVTIDPNDMSNMYIAMRNEPDTIHVAPTILWPKTTGLDRWVWAHKKYGTQLNEWQQDRDDIDTASFCFTYLPRPLINLCIKQGMDDWIYPNVDYNVFMTARNAAFKFNVVRGAFPKHMNY